MHPRTRQQQAKTENLYKQAESEPELDVILSQAFSRNKTAATSKKSKLASKKKMKLNQQVQKETCDPFRPDHVSTEAVGSSKSEDELNNSTFVPEPIGSSNDFQENQPIQLLELDKVVRKASYVKVFDNKILEGFSGHSSAIFKRPILEGKYYFEVKIISGAEDSSKMQEKPSVRVGLCPHDYSNLIPLGSGESICLRTKDGALIHKKKTQKAGVSLSEGDTLGVEIEIAAPQKYPVKTEINEGSKVRFFKNKELLYEWDKLKQIFYSVGISLYNYARVELRICENDIQSLPEGYLPYSESLGQEIQYKELKNSRIFSE